MIAALLKQNLQVLVRFAKTFTRLYRLRFLTFMIPVPYFFICICEHARLHARESTLVTFDLTWNSSAKSQSLARYSVLISWTPAHTIATDFFIKQQICWMKWIRINFTGKITKAVDWKKRSPPWIKYSFVREFGPFL